jgi:hypothetical protein
MRLRFGTPRNKPDEDPDAVSTQQWFGFVSLIPVRLGGSVAGPLLLEKLPPRARKEIESSP